MFIYGKKSLKKLSAWPGFHIPVHPVDEYISIKQCNFIHGSRIIAFKGEMNSTVSMLRVIWPITGPKDVMESRLIIIRLDTPLMGYYHGNIAQTIYFLVLMGLGIFFFLYIFIGISRCGKSFISMQAALLFIHNGYKLEDILIINFDDERLENSIAISLY